MSLDLLHDAKGTVHRFGVECQFIPKSGSSRTIRAVINDSGMNYADGDTSKRVEVISAFVLKDPDTETYGGIGEIERGDMLRIGTDPEERKFGFADRYAEADAVSWKLFFERKATVTISGNNRK